MAEQWQQDLKNLFDEKKLKEQKKQQKLTETQKRFLEFKIQVAKPAFDELANELRKYGQHVLINDDISYAISIHINPSGKRFIYSIELPENMQPDEEMANRVARELAIDPSVVLGIKPGDTWMKGNMNFNESMGEPDEERFQRINSMFKK